MLRTTLSMLLLLAMLAPVAIADDWKETTSEAGNFKVMLPGTTVHSSQTVGTTFGQIDMHTFQSESAKGAAGVLYSDLPDAQFEKTKTDTLLSNARDGAVVNVGGKLTSDKPINVDGHPGREFTFAVGNGPEVAFNGWQRVFLVDQRLYQVIVITVGDQPRPAADIERISGSFTLMR